MAWHLGSASILTEYEFPYPPTALVDLDTAMGAIWTEAQTCTFTYWMVDPGDCVPVPE
jgi:hypothetical protein